MTALDVVYPVRTGQTNEELRYSLRSLAHLPHRTVWIVGFCPNWVHDVRKIRVAQSGSKWENSTANLKAAVAHPDVSDRFVLMNDDFFILEPIATVPVLHRGRMREIGSGWSGRYRQGNTAAIELLDRWGHPDPLSYELHVPMTVDKATMADVLGRLGRDGPVLAGVAKRSLYGNEARVGGDQIDDVKLASPDDDLPDGPFVSTNDRSFRGHLADQIHRLFPDPSPYERSRDPELWVHTTGRTVRVRPGSQLHKRLGRDDRWRPA